MSSTAHFSSPIPRTRRLPNLATRMTSIADAYDAMSTVRPYQQPRMRAGAAEVLYGLAVELFALMGIFFVLSVLHDDLGSDRLSDFRGVLRRAVPESVCLIFFVLTFVGMPPTPGFVTKFSLIEVTLRHGWPALGVAAIIASRPFLGHQHRHREARAETRSGRSH